VHRAVILALAALAPIASAIAQAPRTLTVRIDNDAFNFWTMPWKRPDGEYTSGVHIAYEGGAAPVWARLFWASRTACIRNTRQCQTSRAELGQDIYTPLLSSDTAQPNPSSRPSAGWLYLSQTARALSENRSDDVTLTLGVTGPPSLARLTQRLVHSAAPEFNRPTDWSRQIGFEPGAMLRYQQQHRLAAGRVFDIVPRIVATAGNVDVSAETGVRARLGWHLRHPWLPEKTATEIAIVGGGSARAIARDLFLDGNTFHPRARVGHLPYVRSGEAGVQIRHNNFTLAYRTVTTSRAYDGGPRWHPWSSMVAALTF
jgi:lipid A 3-O-deacylase